MDFNEAAVFVMWLKQQRLRDKTIPAHLVELLEQRLVSANEAVLVNAVRSVTRNGDPVFDKTTVAAVSRVCDATGCKKARFPAFRLVWRQLRVASKPKARWRAILPPTLIVGSPTPPPRFPERGIFEDLP